MYAYLVETTWDKEARSPRQKVLRYLGRADHVRIDDVPEELRQEAAILRWFSRTGVPTGDLAPLRGRLHAAAMQGDGRAVADAAAEGSAALGAWRYLSEVMAPVLHQIGEEWHAGRLTVAQEHEVTRIMEDAVRRVRDAVPVKRDRKHVIVLATPEGEHHSVALEMLAAHFMPVARRIVVLAGGTPARDLARRVEELDAGLVCLSVTGAERIPEALKAANAIRQRTPDVKVALGGQAWQSVPQAKPPKGCAIVRDATPRALDALLEAPA